MQPPLLKYRRLIIVVSQLFLLSLTYCFSFLLRFDFTLQEPYTSVCLKTMPVVIAVKLVVFSYFRLFRGWWRYVGMSDLLDIIKAAVVSAPLSFAAIYYTHGLNWFPRSILVLDVILTVAVIGGTRFAVRAYTESARLHLTKVNTLIVGAGSSGSAIARELNSNEHLEYHPVGFVDDDPSKRGVRIQGIKVLGGTDELPRLIEEHDVAHILIAISSATGRQIQSIIAKCRECKVDFKMSPSLADVIKGTLTMRAVRNVRVEDLLTREPVRLDLGKIRDRLQNRTILITGAGGSIGSELARQVARFNPHMLLLYDRSENDLHKIDVDLSESFPRLRYEVIIGDILQRERLRGVFSAHHPHSVFHAAAFKHVPMMEKNCFEAVANNIFGTYEVADLAGQFAVEDFVLISSDKAVNPVNVMGATKRVAELVILGLQGQKTRFVSVRFGNVLGSKGSVLPLFEEQIARRKPLTITDPEARRYFMIIPEAVQLVLQASTMGQGGEIFVLDMGEPVKIVDLARDLIRLSGLEPDRDIPIIYTGLRPGEKLFEDLKLDAEGVKPTNHEKIRVLDGGRLGNRQVELWMEQLAALHEARNLSGMLSKLCEIVPEYRPSPEILERAEEAGDMSLASSTSSTD